MSRSRSGNESNYVKDQSQNHSSNRLRTTECAARDAQPIGVLPPTFESDYVAGAVAPFLLSGSYTAETPTLPMIDLALSKEKALPIQLWGLFYDEWAPNFDEDGLSVSMQGYENRGPNNERKRIFMSAMTPDLVQSKYRGKIIHFFQNFLGDGSLGKPMMHQYYEHYFDLYWDLHLGITGDDIPSEVKEIGMSFNAVLGFWFPTLDIVRRNYLRVRELRPFLKKWVDDRVQAFIDNKVQEPDHTFVHYWLKNGRMGETFRRKDIVFECFHNLFGFSQWGTTVYNIMAQLESDHGNASVKSWFERTMRNRPDEIDESAFTPLDRFVMELLRTISPSGGSLSSIEKQRQLGSELASISTPHLRASMDPRHWSNPEQFDPDRYKTAPTSVDNDETKARQIGLARCPFAKESFPVKDGRNVELATSAFGAVYSVINDKPYPLCDTAGYAPLGFGYRRCAGEYLTMEFIKEFLRTVWKDKISFAKLVLENQEEIAVGPGAVAHDDITFKRSVS